MTRINKKQKPIMVEPKVTVAQKSPLMGILMEILLFCMALIGYLYCNTTALDVKNSYVIVPIIGLLSMGLMILLVWYKRVFFGVMGGLAGLALLAFPVTKTICAALWRSVEICYNYIIYKLTLQPDYENYADHMTIDLTDLLKNESLLNRHLYTVLVLLSDNQAVLRKRPKKGLLAGLYELPNLEGHLELEEVLEQVKALSLSPIRIQKLPEAKHIFSHIEWQMAGYAVKIEEPEEKPEGLFFVEKAEMESRYSIPAAFVAYTEYFKHRF